MKDEATAEQIELARRIAEQCNPGLHRVSGDLEAVALAAIIETQARDDRLTFTERGDLVLHLVWALKPGQPQIVAVCTYPELAEKYKSAAGQIVPGATGYVEEMIADHAFGRQDIQTAIYKAVNRAGKHYGKDTDQ